MNADLLTQWVPFNALNPQSLALVAGQCQIETLAAGSKLFQQGDADPDAIYLLEGEVGLTALDGQRQQRVVAGTAQARYALAQLKPRLYTGLALTPAKIMRIDSQWLDRLLSWDQASAAYEVTEFASGQDAAWVMRLLGNPIFHRLPPANINQLFHQFQRIVVKAGQIIIRQGEPGDYYYLIQSGAADVIRKQAKTHKAMVLDRISEGGGFGEDALLTGAPRNATIVMTADGALLRLGRKEFDELLREPLVNWLGLDEVREQVKAGANLLDVRLEEEYQQGTIKGSVNLPLNQLRSRCAELDANRHHILFCQTGLRSAAAAFLLTERGFRASALKGGLDRLRGSAAA